MNRDLLRIIDANLNRSREGLRVCEEIVRFILDDAKLTGEFKKLRNKISRNIKKFPGQPNSLLKCRACQTDVGRNLKNLLPRKSYQDVFLANIQRAKESLRVLEEFSSIYNRSLSNNFGKLRFKVYQLEKKVIARF